MDQGLACPLALSGRSDAISTACDDSASNLGQVVLAFFSNLKGLK
jgi:hypothetical protein